MCQKGKEMLNDYNGPMTNRSPGILWDMDGVLVDTGEFHYLSWVQTLTEMGIPIDRLSFRNVFGKNNRDTLEALLGRLPEPQFLAQVSEHKESLFRELIRGKAQPLPGVLAWLERLRRLGARQAVASSAPQENIDFLVDELGLRSYFMALCAAHEIPGKPDPAIFLLAASALELPPQDCIVIEDSLVGITAAKRAGMRCIAVATTNPPEALAEADLVLQRLDQLNAEDAIRQLIDPLL
jgi:HAD superfamily hydrolase (TIGR01509 family)